MIVFKVPLKYKDGTSPKGIMFTWIEMMNWGGMNICDMCNEDIITDDNNYGFMIPNAYGSYGICQNCYNAFIKKGKLYEEDKDNDNEESVIKSYSRFAIGGVITNDEE